MRGIIRAIFLAMVVIIAGQADAAEVPAAGFFKGKVITYIVGTKPGGGYDAYARLIGKYMQKYIPGAVIIVKNVPGAGHIIGANDTYLAKPDGLTIGTFNQGLVYTQIMGSSAFRADMTKYSWIGKASSETRVFVISVKSPYKSIRDVMESKEAIKMASGGVGTTSYNDVLIVAAATGAKLKIIPGYGGPEMDMAMMRGEVAGQIGSYTGLISFIKTKECRVILQMAAKKHKDLPDTPLASELKISEKAKRILAVIEGTAELGRLTAGPPGIPAGRLQVLREAYKNALSDGNLQKEAAKIGLDIDPAYGDQVARLVQAAINQPPENLDILRKIIKITD